MSLLCAGVLAGLSVGSAALAAAPPAATTAKASADLGPSERLLLDLREAYGRSDQRALSAGLPRLKGHPLEPLAAYWDMRLRLESASHDDIRAFLRRFEGSYHEDRLRNDWLLLLGRRGDWEAFGQELPLYRMNDDREVQCYALLADYMQRGTDVSDRVGTLWLAQRDADEGCANAARVLLQDRKMPASTAWKRARQGMERNQSRVVQQAISAINADWLPLVAPIQNQPARFLDEKVTAFRARTKELVTLALVRLASSDTEAAAKAADRWRWKVQLTDEERSWIWAVIGKRSAQELSSEAAAYFARSDSRHLSADLLAWKVRAGLRAGHWALVRDAVAAMDETQRREAVWSYWQARALQALGTPDAQAQAREMLQRIASSDGFYEQLALEATGRSVTQPPAPAPLTRAEREQARANPGLQRALLAIAIGLRAEGVREWNYSTNLHTPGGMGERELLAAADLACQREVWDRCINTSQRTSIEVDQAQRFPTPFREAVVQRSREIGLDPAFVYGLIRQESRFVMDARSGVGASGLMQVMPKTASWTAKRIGLAAFHPRQLSDIDTNIAIGTAYLKFVLEDFEGSMAMATAAYNAGPGRPRAWRNGPRLEAAVWIENIPFHETRDYVKRVLANATNYAVLLTGQPQTLSSRLAPIGPREATAQAPDNELP